MSLGSVIFGVAVEATRSEEAAIESSRASLHALGAFREIFDLDLERVENADPAKLRAIATAAFHAESDPAWYVDEHDEVVNLDEREVGQRTARAAKDAAARFGWTDRETFAIAFAAAAGAHAAMVVDERKEAERQREATTERKAS